MKQKTKTFDGRKVFNRKPDHERQENRKEVLLNDNELLIVTSKAKEMGISFSSYARLKLLDKLK